MKYFAFLLILPLAFCSGVHEDAADTLFANANASTGSVSNYVTRKHQSLMKRDKEDARRISYFFRRPQRVAKVVGKTIAGLAVAVKEFRSQPPRFVRGCRKYGKAIREVARDIFATTRRRRATESSSLVRFDEDPKRLFENVPRNSQKADRLLQDYAQSGQAALLIELVDYMMDEVIGVSIAAMPPVTAKTMNKYMEKIIQVVRVIGGSWDDVKTMALGKALNKFHPM